MADSLQIINIDGTDYERDKLTDVQVKLCTHIEALQRRCNDLQRDHEVAWEALQSFSAKLADSLGKNNNAA